jgi:hypothetical protein
MKSVLSDRKEPLMSTFVLPIPSNSISTSSERSADERVDEREKLAREVKTMTDRSAKRALGLFPPWTTDAKRVYPPINLLTPSTYFTFSVLPPRSVSDAVVPLKPGFSSMVREVSLQQYL